MLYRWGFINIKLVLTLSNAQLIYWIELTMNAKENAKIQGKTQLSLLSLCDTSSYNLCNSCIHNISH